MVIITLHCSHCQSDTLVRNGHAPNGKQLYRCRTCGRQSRENPTPHAYPQARREEILSAYQERSSLRGLTRTFGVSRTTVTHWIKKVAQLPPLSTTLLAPDPEESSSTTLELDEVWSFVLKKAKQSWMWIALCRKTRQVVAYAALEIGANKPVNGCGKPFHLSTATGIAEPPSGSHTLRAFLTSNTRQEVKRPEKPLTWSAGITRCASALPVLSA